LSLETTQQGQHAAALRRALLAEVQQLVAVRMSVDAVAALARTTVARTALAWAALGTRSIGAAVRAAVVTGVPAVHAVIKLAASIEARSGNRQQDKERPFHDNQVHAVSVLPR
jgi:hypothetical protein